MDELSENDFTDSVASDKDKFVKPTPDNFDEYLPWACRHLEVNVNLVITNIQAKTYVNQRTSLMTLSGNHTTRGKIYQKPYHTTKQDKANNGIIHKKVFTTDTIKLFTVYDSSNNLVQLKFDKNKRLPSEVLRVIGLFLQFHTCLSNITINRGLDKATIHELSRLLASSRITDICLDDTTVPDANYDLLLETENHLRYLSLSRCKIDDDVLKAIASKLSHSLPASKTLCILNLASNSITDRGAKCLAEVLRTNRQLAYLNLSNNLITDKGATAILEVLKVFPLSNDELIEYETRHILYLKEKYEIISQASSKLFTEEISHLKKKIVRKPNYVPSKKDHTTKLMARKELAGNSDIKDLFYPKNLDKTGGLVYSYGNNHLAYLNLSYNNLSYFSVKEVLNVLTNQKVLNRNPRGLVNVCLEGNCFPMQCVELKQIDELLESNLAQYKRPSKNIKKSMSKSSAKKSTLKSA